MTTPITKANQIDSTQTYEVKQGTVTPDGVVNYDPNTGQKLATGQSVTANQGSNIYGATPTTPENVYKEYQAPVGSTESPEMVKTRQDYESYLTSLQQPNEDEIQANTLKKFQAEIDAVNQMYAQELERAKVQGTGRLGTTTAIGARRGLLGSDFGESQYRGQEDANEQVYKMIEQERVAKTQSIMSQAKRDASEEIRAKREAFTKGLEARLEYYAQADERKANNTNKAIQNLLAQGISPKDIDPAQLKQLAGYYGVSVEDIKEGYIGAKKEFDAQQEKAQFERQKEMLGISKTEAEIAKMIKDTELAGERFGFDKQKFEEEKRQFGLEYALKTQKLALEKMEASQKNNVGGGFKGEVATQGRVAVTNMLNIAKQNPAIFGKSAAAPIPDMFRSDAYRNYSAQLDSLKGNIIPAALAAMREASKTGGALGNVSDREGSWLAASLGALNMSQTPDQVINQLMQIDASLARWQQAVSQSGTTTQTTQTTQNDPLGLNI